MVHGPVYTRPAAMVRCGGRLSCRDAMSLVEAHGDFYTATFSRHLHHQNPDKLQLVARILEERNSVAANLLRVNCLLQTMHRHDRWCRTTKETSTGTAVVSPAAVDNLQDPHQSVCGEHLLQVRMLLQPRWHFIVWHLIAPRNPCQASCINMLYVYCRCTEFCDAERCGVLRMLAQARSAIAYKPCTRRKCCSFFVLSTSFLHVTCAVLMFNVSLFTM